jgi:hypothetical protein
MARRGAAFVVVAAMAFLAAACSGTDGDADPSTTAPESTTPDSTTPDSTTPETTAPEPEPVPGAELVGRWAHYDIVAYEEPLMRTLIISYGFNDYSVENGTLVDTGSFCFAEQVTDQPISTSLSDAATQAIKPVPTPVAVSVDDGVLRVQRPPTPTPVGIRLDDPANDVLPTDPADPRIVDDDGDGNPGITVQVRFGEGLEAELFIARREIFEYDVTLTGPDELTGVVIDSSEQLVIGATNELLLATEAQWTQYPDLSRSPIILRRVTADWDCDRLRAERDDIFPPNPAIDW